MKEIINILRDRFKSLEESLDLDDKDFAYALFDYCAYISSSESLSRIIRKMADEGDIEHGTFHWLFMFGALRNTIKNFKTGNVEKGDFGIPLFWDKKIEEHYGVAEGFMRVIAGIKNNQDHIQNTEKIDIYDILSSEKGEFFVIKEVPLKKVIIKMRLMQNDLLSRMIEQPKTTISFNPDKSILSVGKDNISFRKHTDQYHTLRIIFEDQQETMKEWFFSEISERIDPSKEHKDKNFYNYISAIDRRVSSETGIKDIFHTTNQSVRINSSYLR